MDRKEEIGRPGVGLCSSVGEENPCVGAATETGQPHFGALALELSDQGQRDGPYDIGLARLRRVLSDGARVHSSVARVDIHLHVRTLLFAR